MNQYTYNIEPIQLIDEVSSTEFYIGLSNNGRDTSKEIWKINKITKNGNVWNISQFPNGSQKFEFIWDNRATYTYL